VKVLARLLATALGVGYSPVAPGTCGTAVAVPLAWVLASLPLWQYAAITIAITLIGIWAASAADRSWGTHDSGRIVIDEVAGYLVTVALVDRHSWLALGVGFLVFRVLDIGKPPPVRQVDRMMGGGTGVVLDDVMAGVYGLALMALGGYLSLWPMSGF